MKIIYNYGCQRYTSFLILAGNIKHIILALITQPALPESCSPFRKLRSISGKITINL